MIRSSSKGRGSPASARRLRSTSRWRVATPAARAIRALRKLRRVSMRARRSRFILAPSCARKEMKASRASRKAGSTAAFTFSSGISVSLSSAMIPRRNRASSDVSTLRPSVFSASASAAVSAESLSRFNASGVVTPGTCCREMLTLTRPRETAAATVSRTVVSRAAQARGRETAISACLRLTPPISTRMEEPPRGAVAAPNPVMLFITCYCR